MTTKELKFAIENQKSVFFNNKSYLPIGYKFLFIKNQKIHSAILQDENKNYFHVSLSKINGKGD